MDQSSTNWKTPFFTIWAGQAFSLFGSRVAQFALIWWLTTTTGSATVLATATLVGLIPEIALGPIAGAYVDRWNRRTVMFLADGLIALASLWLAVMFWMDIVQVWQVYAIMVVRAVGGSFHWPAMQASTSLMVPKDQLTRVAGLNQTLQGVLNIIGPPAGALLMALLPLQGVMLVDVASAAIAMTSLFFVHIPQPQKTRDAQGAKAGSSVWSDLRDGLHYLWGWPGIVALIGMVMLHKIVSMPAFTLIPLLVSSHFGGGAPQLSLLEALFGVGIILGGLILSVWGGFQRKIYTAFMGIIIFSFGFLGLGLAPGDQFPMALGSAFVIGLMVPMTDGPLMAILQSTVAPEMQGRVFMLIFSLINLVSPLSLAVAGPISDLAGLQMWYIVAGVSGLGMGLFGFLIPALVNIEENANGKVKQEGELAQVDAVF
jgi:DHA3 family macrolide efflux protein-like MFS transporter